MKRNAHVDETILILGSGPSLNDFCVNDLQKFTCVGINQISRRMDPDYVTLLDSPTGMGEGMGPALRSLIRSKILVSRMYESEWRALRPDADITVIDWLPAHSWREWREEDYLKTVDQWDDDAGALTALPFGPTSMATAVWLAAFFGAKEIGCIGLDMGPDYFFESRVPFATPPTAVDEANYHWEQLSEMVRKVTGARVWNLSNRTLIKSMAFKDIQEFFSDWERPS
ncbi:MAG: hypothetical protein GY701_28895 [Sulfitobacter sp.]|nr:hypothetical protein [Sulfitobacter sp.]